MKPLFYACHAAGASLLAAGALLAVLFLLLMDHEPPDRTDWGCWGNE